MDYTSLLILTVTESQSRSNFSIFSLSQFTFSTTFSTRNKLVDWKKKSLHLYSSLLLLRLSQHSTNCSFWHLVVNSHQFNDLENLGNSELGIALKTLFLVANIRFVFVQDCNEDFYPILLHPYFLLFIQPINKQPTKKIKHHNTVFSKKLGLPPW